MHQNRSHHHHGTAEGRFTAKKWFGHRAGRSPCAHSIGKFFLCYIVLFSSETSAPGSPGNYLYICCFKPRFYVRCFLTITSWRKTHLAQACTFISRSSLHVRNCTEYFSGIACENIDRDLFLACCCKPTFYVLVLTAFPWGNPHLERFF